MIIQDYTKKRDDIIKKTKDIINSVEADYKMNQSKMKNISKGVKTNGTKGDIDFVLEQDKDQQIQQIQNTLDGELHSMEEDLNTWLINNTGKNLAGNRVFNLDFNNAKDTFTDLLTSQIMGVGSQIIGQLFNFNPSAVSSVFASTDQLIKGINNLRS